MVSTACRAEEVADAPNEFLVFWKDDVSSVRGLYRECKYRRCAILCSELLEKAKHAVHRTFLLFYLAICYESLGYIAHNYSTNKIRFLEQARDAFISAGEILPLPYLTKLGGQYDTPGLSPDCPTFDMLALYGNTPSVYPPTTPVLWSKQREGSFSDSSVITIRSIDQVSTAYAVPNFDDYSPRQSIDNRKSVHDETHKAFLTPIERADSNHKSRLSRSLSSQHNFAEELVPSPLFRHDPSSKKEAQQLATTKIVTLPLVTLSKPLPPTPVNRPLPALPFNHQPEFVLKGKRFLLVPRRKTALATLISRFEGKMPFDSPSPQEEKMQMVAQTPTPTTERFKRISAVFNHSDTLREATYQQSPNRSVTSRKQDSTISNFNGKESRQFDLLIASPKTPCPKPQTLAIQQPTPSSKYSMPSQAALTPPPSPHAHLALYSAHLSSLRTAIKSHITDISEKINSVHAIQLAHEDEKRQRFANMQSRHSSFIPSPTKSKGQRGSRISPAKDARLRSFWSLQVAEHSEIARSEGLGGQKSREQKERITKLRAEGWTTVRKENKGWKGAKYYEDLRTSVERELSCY